MILALLAPVLWCCVLRPCSSLEESLQLNSAAAFHDRTVLSRHRRFLYPSSTGWSMKTTFALTAPSQDGSTLKVEVPFQYKFDTQIWTAR